MDPRCWGDTGSPPENKMAIRLFFDSSALFAAAYSPCGGAGELIRMAIPGQVQIVISQEVAEESLSYLRRIFFVTLDKKHLLGNPTLAAFARKGIGHPSRGIGLCKGAVWLSAGEIFWDGGGF